MATKPNGRVAVDKPIDTGSVLMIEIQASNLSSVRGGVLINNGNTPWGPPGQVVEGWSWWNQEWFNRNILGIPLIAASRGSTPAQAAS